MSLAQGPHVWKRSFQSASEALAIAIMSLKKVTDSTWPGDVEHETNTNSQNQDKASWAIIHIINQMALPNQTTPCPSFFYFSLCQWSSWSVLCPLDTWLAPCVANPAANSRHVNTYFTDTTSQCGKMPQNSLDVACRHMTNLTDSINITDTNLY